MRALVVPALLVPAMALLAPAIVSLTAATALADASTPGKATKTIAPPSQHGLEYVASPEGAANPTWHFTEYKTGDTLFLVRGGGDRVIRKVLEPGVVDGRHDRWYIVGGEIAADYHEVRMFGADLTPFEFLPPGAAVTVAFGADFKIHVHSAGLNDDLVLEPAGQAYLSQRGGNVTATLVDEPTPVPLIKVSSRPEACSDFWDIYVSVVDGVPRQALALYGVADPPAMQSSTVKFARDGSAVVTTRTSEDEKHTRITRTRYRFDGRVYVAVPKGASARSK